jgi:hypothetical protein
MNYSITLLTTTIPSGISATPIFLRLFATPQASDWIYFYKVDWNTPVEGYASALVEREKVGTRG